MFGISIKSSKYRFYTFISILLISAIIVYKIALGVTFELISTNDGLSKRLNELQSNSITTSQSNTPTLNEYVLPTDSTLDYKNKLYSRIENISTKNNVELIEFRSLNDIVITDGVIITQQLKLSGDYVALLRSLNLIEELKIKYKLNSLKFVKTRNTKTKNDELLLELFFQAIVKVK